MIQYLKLGSLTRIRTGKLDANAADDNGKYPFFTCSKEPLSINTCSYDCECVLVAGNGDLNVKYYDGKFDAYQRTYIIESLDKTKLMVKYLYCFLDLYVEILRQQAIGGVIKYIKLGNLADAIIPVPVIEKQREIIEIFEKCNGTIAYRHQELLLMDQLVKSRFIELFGDPQRNPHGYKHTKLSDIATYYNGLTYKPENVAAEGTIVLRSSNIQNSQLDFADTIRVDCAIKERLMVQKNDILMCSRNGSAKLVGKVALIKDIQEPMSFGAFMMIIRSHYFGYLMTYFQMDAFRQQIKTGATTTINQITGRMLDDVTIPLPPMALVDQFAAFVEQTDKSKFYIIQMQILLRLLIRAIQQKTTEVLL